MVAVDPTADIAKQRIINNGDGWQHLLPAVLLFLQLSPPSEKMFPSKIKPRISAFLSMSGLPELPPMMSLGRGRFGSDW